MLRVSETTFKVCYSNHKKSFTNKRHKSDTELSKEYWKVKQQNGILRLKWKTLTLLKMGFLWATHGCWGGGKAPLLKIHHTHPPMMKLDTAIPYLRKIQKKYESCDTSFEFCWHQHFFTWNWQSLLCQETRI